MVIPFEFYTVFLLRILLLLTINGNSNMLVFKMSKSYNLIFHNRTTKIFLWNSVILDIHCNLFVFASLALLCDCYGVLTWRRSTSPLLKCTCAQCELCSFITMVNIPSRFLSTGVEKIHTNIWRNCFLCSPKELLVITRIDGQLMTDLMFAFGNDWNHLFFLNPLKIY